MACIDCHLSYELMGDGSSPVHKEEAVKIQCVDCHPVATPTTVRISELPDRESQMVAWLRKYNVQGRVILTQKGKLPLLNTKVDSLDRLVLTDKLYGKTHLSKPVSSACTKGKGHERLSCEACHTAWVPQCIGCHNAFEKETSGFDLLEGKQIKGTWVEYAGKSFGEPPVLGVSEAAGSKIVTATPGMILTIDHQSFSPGAATGFHRLYAPASGHTTQREGRSCKSCHNDPLAIGFGRGDLRFEISNGKGRWKFEPRFTSNTSDGLPEDAWTGFLREAIPPYSTRSTLRPFNVNEQKRILEVGSCLTCHNEKSGVMTATLENYPQSLARRKIQCTKTQ
jgi:hypothetical protein